MSKLLKQQPQARRHVGAQARSATSARISIDFQTPLAASHHRAFSLIEVLLAIFILGVGVISIAALFPAGIVQQRQSVDEIVGPVVANNAMEIIRSKIRAADFGTFEDFNIRTYASPRPTIVGDWNWLRPGFLFGDDPATIGVDETGAIDIFSGASAFSGTGTYPVATEYPGSSGYVSSSSTGNLQSFPTLHGIPYNRNDFAAAPRFIITREERYYPMGTQLANGSHPKPQFVWDCMFRRYQGKIMVAIFVYRASVPGGGSANYSVAPNASNPNVPPLPVALDISTASNWCADGPWPFGGLDGDITTGEDNAKVYGTAGGTAFDLDDQRQGWQAPRQWILDQNCNIYRVLGVERPNDDAANKVQVELTRPLADTPYDFTQPNPHPLIATQYLPAPTPPNHLRLVSDMWYIPLSDFSNGATRYSLTPVYVTVKEL
jgi:prepilin-type N-terminal cleavage/methylation domain-containing protein